MNILVTAGNTLVPIDRVRAITNVFTGRTGARLALHALDRGHHVTLVTSHPEVVGPLRAGGTLSADRWELRTYWTFDDLQETLRGELFKGDVDALIHCAAVSDYKVAGVYAPAADTHFHEETGAWEAKTPDPPALVDRLAGKVKSDEPEVWLRLTRTPKLVDLVRSAWSFPGILVKFKLEVGVDDELLKKIAEKSRTQSAADLLVANTLEGANSWAFLGPINGEYLQVARPELPRRLLDVVEVLYRERGNSAIRHR